jgi:hypothetical protein
MYSLKLILAIFAMLLSPIVDAENGDPCTDIRRIESDARVVLKETALDGRNIFIGTFLIQNLSKKNIVLKGNFPASGGPIRIVRPDYSIEYLDLSNQWQQRIELPGSFLGAKDERVVPPGKSLLFTAPLVSAKYASKSASDFRLLVRTKNSTACLMSVPFRGYPPRPEVIRLETVKDAESD